MPGARLLWYDAQMNFAPARPLSRLTALFLVAVLAVSPTLLSATCGGGGGGGVGGIGGGGGTEVYQVPWKGLTPQDAPPAGGLVLYWFPASVDEVKNSGLRVSRTLALYATQCVSMTVAEVSAPIGEKLAGKEQLPVAVLATADGTALGTVQNVKGILKVDQVEKLVEGEVKQREAAATQALKQGKEKAKSGDAAGAIELLKQVVAAKCLFPGKAKDAAKELKKLGVTDVAALADAPVFEPVYERVASRNIERIMKLGLKAEMAARYTEAEKYYAQAAKLDPADPAPLRYLGELYRHQTGQWDKARESFNALLAMPNDPLSRAVALHGLGKMTIHGGEFLKGVSLMEQSVATFPLPLAYRNLAVYWNSEGDKVKADHYTQEALKLDPKDPYNLVFAAAFMAGNGHGDEALKIARENVALLPASYNLAAIYAQTGQKEKALALLKRHFFTYERYRAVRSMEMEEARVDAVFASIKQDPGFVALTSGADGRLTPMTPMNH